MNTAKIRINNLALRALVGVNPQERIEKQKIIANVEMLVDVSRAIESDKLDHSVNYHSVAKKIIEESEKTEFFLLENLTDFVLGIVMEDERVIQATVILTKPHALHFADSVSCHRHSKISA